MVEDGSEVTLEIEIEELLDAGIRRQGEQEGVGREKGFHISGLSYECMRNIQYGQIAEQETPRNLASDEEVDDGTYRMWIGTMLHRTPLTPKHEWGVYRVFDVNGKKIKVHGHVDEIHERKDGTEVIIDKKFVASVPRQANDHHKRQISYYAAMYGEATGAKVVQGAILYFAPVVTRFEGVKRKKVFTFPIDVKAAMAELEQKVREVQGAIDAGKLLSRNVHWLCAYCRWRKDCIERDGPIEIRIGGKMVKFTE